MNPSPATKGESHRSHASPETPAWAQGLPCPAPQPQPTRAQGPGQATHSQAPSDPSHRAWGRAQAGQTPRQRGRRTCVPRHVACRELREGLVWGLRGQAEGEHGPWLLLMQRCPPATKHWLECGRGWGPNKHRENPEKQPRSTCAPSPLPRALRPTRSTHQP